MFFFKLNLNLIPRAVGYNWVLSFSTEANGFSLNTMYRTLADVDTPCLIVIMDTNRNVTKLIYIYFMCWCLIFFIQIDEN